LKLATNDAAKQPMPLNTNSSAVLVKANPLTTRPEFKNSANSAPWPVG
jgi:hypothetical protein